MKKTLMLMMFLTLAGCGGGSSNSGEAVKTPSNNENPAKIDNTATLSWSHPNTRENGESLSLSEIQHYVITHRINNEVLEYTVPYPEENYKLENLEKGTHYFSIIVVDNEGRKSKPSDEVFKTI
jgi:hypothetical protein